MNKWIAEFDLEDGDTMPEHMELEYKGAKIDYHCRPIKALPSAQPKRGKWISADAIFGGVPFYCSECGENTRDTVMGKPRWNFCPNCGADMREVTE